MMGFLRKLKTVLESKPDSYIVILLVIGFVVFLAKFIIVYPIQYIGYAEMADSLIYRRGLEVDYISSYFMRYDSQVSRPEDHWPPLVVYLLYIHRGDGRNLQKQSLKFWHNYTES